MGIRDRDYMKRPSDDDGQDGSYSSPESGTEGLVGEFLQKHPRFFLYVGLGLGILIVAALIAAKFSDTGH